MLSDTSLLRGDEGHRWASRDEDAVPGGSRSRLWGRIKGLAPRLFADSWWQARGQANNSSWQHAGESREAASASVVVPGPLCAISKPLFHEAALNNLENELLPASQPCLGWVWVQTGLGQPQKSPPLPCLGSVWGFCLPSWGQGAGDWLSPRRVMLVVWCLAQPSCEAVSKLPFFP